MSKHFILTPNPIPVSKETVQRIEAESAMIKWSDDDRRNKESLSVLSEYDSLKHVEGRVIVKNYQEGKNWHTFESGEKIRLERKFNNFNLREVNPVNCIVISGDGLQYGTEIIVDYNAIQDTYQINSYKNKDADIKYYSVPVDLCYLIKIEDEWKAIPPYETALRVFKPYSGPMIGIPPTLLKDTLYVASGRLKGQVVRTLICCDYCVVFQDSNGREGNIIRFLPDGDPLTKKEEEAICILDDVTEKVNSGEYLIGLTITDAKSIL